MSDYEVTLVDGKMNEFSVSFKGPEESKSPYPLVLRRSRHPDLTLDSLRQPRSLAGRGRSTSNCPKATRTSRPRSALRTRSFTVGPLPSIPLYRDTCKQTDPAYAPPSTANIDELSGSVCLDVINQTWSPMFDMVNIFETFLPQLLRYPNAADPLNGEAAALLMRDPKAYDAKVKGESPRAVAQGHTRIRKP